MNGLILINKNIRAPWSQWAMAFVNNHGLFTEDGFTPIGSVATIQVVPKAGQMSTVEIGGNVIPFGGKK